jgi:hypothetical protein
LFKEVTEMPAETRVEIALFALLIIGAALRSFLADVSVTELVLYIALAAGLLAGYLAGLARGRERTLKERGKCPHCGTRILLLLFHMNEKQFG